MAKWRAARVSRVQSRLAKTKQNALLIRVTDDHMRTRLHVSLLFFFFSFFRGGGPPVCQIGTYDKNGFGIGEQK